MGAEWASGDNNQVVQWDTGKSGDVAYHKFFRKNQEEFKEASEIASWGTWYLTTRSDNGVSLLACRLPPTQADATRIVDLADWRRHRGSRTVHEQ